MVHVFAQHSEHPTRLESENCHGIVSNSDDDSSEGSLPPGYDSMDMGIPNVAGVGQCSQNSDLILGDPLFPDKIPSLRTQTKGLPWLHLGFLLKTSSSLFLLISSSQRSLTLLPLFLCFLKTVCLHVSFTAYENFSNYLKCIVSSFCFPLSFHQKYQKTEIPQSNIYPLIHHFIHP